MSKFLLNEKDKSKNDQFDGGFNRTKKSDLISTDFLNKSQSNFENEIPNKTIFEDKAVFTI